MTKRPAAKVTTWALAMGKARRKLSAWTRMTLAKASTDSSRSKKIRRKVQAWK